MSNYIKGGYLLKKEEERKGKKDDNAWKNVKKKYERKFDVGTLTVTWSSLELGNFLSV